MAPVCQALWTAPWNAPDDLLPDLDHFMSELPDSAPIHSNDLNLNWV